MICRTIISQTSTSSKKVQNSDLRWGPLHCKIGVLILQILFWKYLRLNSRVKYLKFIKTSALFLSALVLICNCSFHPSKMYLEWAMVYGLTSVLKESSFLSCKCLCTAFYILYKENQHQDTWQHPKHPWHSTQTEFVAIKVTVTIKKYLADVVLDGAGEGVHL